jgi:hypothetical protein
MLSREPDLNMTNSEASKIFRNLNLLANSLVHLSFCVCSLEISSLLSLASIVEIDAGEFCRSLIRAFPNVYFKADFLRWPDRLAQCLFMHNRENVQLNSAPATSSGSYDFSFNLKIDSLTTTPHPVDIHRPSSTGNLPLYPNVHFPDDVEAR